MITRTVRERTYTYSHSVGRLALAGEGFWSPMDVALATGGIAYVISANYDSAPSARVTKCSLGEDQRGQQVLLDFGSFGEDEGQFTRPTSLALDRQGRVYVADEWLNRVSVFSDGGDYLGSWGRSGSGEGELLNPWGLAFDAGDDLWVADTGNNRVQKFSKDGRFLAAWATGGQGPGELDNPWGIATDGEGNVYLADWRNARVQKFTESGRYLSFFGAPGSGEGELAAPSGVAVDEEGDVYVVDWGAHRLQVYAPDGSHLTTFLGDAQRLSQWGQQFVKANPDFLKARNKVTNMEPEWRFAYPTGMDVGPDRQIVVCDQQHHRVQVYVKEKDYVEPQFNL